MADLFIGMPMCDQCEDAHHYFFTCSKYTIFRGVLCQTIQNIIDCNHIFDLDLSLYGSPHYGFITNTQIFEAVHTYMAVTKRFI